MRNCSSKGISHFWNKQYVLFIAGAVGLVSSVMGVVCNSIPVKKCQKLLRLKSKMLLRYVCVLTCQVYICAILVLRANLLSDGNLCFLLMQ